MDHVEKILSPVHPGEILREEFFLPSGVTEERLSSETGIPLADLRSILAEEASFTRDQAVCLALFFGTSVKFWTNLQENWESKRRVV